MSTSILICKPIYFRTWFQFCGKIWSQLFMKLDGRKESFQFNEGAGLFMFVVIQWLPYDDDMMIYDDHIIIIWYMIRYGIWYKRATHCLNEMRGKTRKLLIQRRQGWAQDGSTTIQGRDSNIFFSVIIS